MIINFNNGEYINITSNIIKKFINLDGNIRINDFHLFLEKYCYNDNEYVGIILFDSIKNNYTLTINEKKRFIDIIYGYDAIHFNKKRIIANVSCDTLEETLILINSIINYIEGIVVTIPYCNNLQQKDIIDYFKCISNKFPNLEIMMYNTKSCNETIIKKKQLYQLSINAIMLSHYMMIYGVFIIYMNLILC
jgi:hypothetical protein